MLARSFRKQYAWLPWLIIVIAVTVFVGGALGLQYIEHRMVMSKGESLALAAAEIADKLDWLIAERVNDVRVFSIEPTFQTVDAAAKSVHLEALRKVYAPVYLWIGVTDARGRTTAATGSFTGTRDMSGSPWFRAVLENGNVHIGNVEPFAEAGGIDALSFTAPIKDRQDKFLGTVTTLVGLPVLEEILTLTIRAFQAREGLTGTIEYQFLNDSGDAFIDSNLLHKGNVNLKRLGLPSALFGDSGQPGYIEETHLRRHVPVITGYAQTQGYGAPANVKWTILLRMDQADLLLPIRETLWTITMAGAFIVIPMFIALIWSTERLREEWILAQQEHARAAEAESKYSAILESTDEGIYGLDPNGCLTFINRAGAAMLGFTPQELLGRSMHVIHHHSHSDGSPYPDQDCPIFQAFRSNRGCRVNTEVFWRRDGTTFPVEYASHPLLGEGARTVGAVVTFIDITERKQAESVLQSTNQALQALSRKLLQVQEDDRRAIARDLHDEIGQSLTAIKMTVERAQRTPDLAARDRIMKVCIQTTEYVLNQVRNLSLDLHPSILDDLGLAYALKWYADRQAELAGLNVTVTADLSLPRLPPNIEITCFRIAQEALTNVMRHAQASRVSITLRRWATGVELRVQDDGIGFVMNKISGSSGVVGSIGLTSMHERAEIIGGALKITTAPRFGTEVIATLPLHAAAPDGTPAKKELPA